MAKIIQNGLLVLLFGVIIANANIFAQGEPASGSAWLFPNGGANGLKNPNFLFGGAQTQSLDSFKLKWSSSDISGDVVPLIGNIINNGKIDNAFPFAPNEMVAVVGAQIVLIDANGKTHKISKAPQFVKSVSVLFDTMAIKLNPFTFNPVVLGLETVEFENKFDSMAFAYIAAYDANADSIAVAKRLAINMRPYKPNNFASIKPVFGRSGANETYVYALVNTSKPDSGTAKQPSAPPYLRGITMFKSSHLLGNFPMPDIGDDYPDNRVTLAPEVAFETPSIEDIDNVTTIMLPSYPSTFDREFGNPATIPTKSNKPYLMGFDINDDGVREKIFPDEMTNYTSSVKPFQTRSFTVKLIDRNTTTLEEPYILVTEEYRGLDGSNGTSRLHLFDKTGATLTSDVTKAPPPFAGGKDHLWSIGAGNVDGAPSNEWLPYYPNNYGNEIIATQSSKDFVVENSKLFILRYNTASIPKASPPTDNLYSFDTIVTARINGWLAAVNDIDRLPDGKDEMFLVDGSTLRVVKLRDYSSYEFRISKPLDTLFSYTFPNETIFSVEVADLEGDGFTDIIVTTNNKTYVLGVNINNGIKIQSPKTYSSPPVEYCLSDSLKIVWINQLKGLDKVQIKFEEFVNGKAISPKIVLDSAINNDKDTMTYIIANNLNLIGKTGKFYVESKYDEKVYDTTCVLTIARRNTSFDGFWSSSIRVGETLHATGDANCADSVLFEYQLDSLHWAEFTKTAAINKKDFDVYLKMPCLNIFRVDSADYDSLISIRAIGQNPLYNDTSAIAKIKLLPADFPATLDTAQDICPTQIITWKKDEILYPCDSIDIAFSIDDGKSFRALGKAALADEKFVWLMKVDMPDIAILRIMCSGSCARKDTLMSGLKPRYIDKAAPNPFNPTLEICDIVYKVPMDTKADLKIYDQNNQLVAIIEENADKLAGYAYNASWDGRIISGAYAANGIYYLVVEISSGSKDVIPIFIKK